MALRRQIAFCLGVFAVAGSLLGCGGGEETTNAKIDPVVADSIREKLAQVKERVDAGSCSGENSAQSSLESLQGEVGGPLLAEERPEFRDDLQELLRELGDQIDAECVEAETSPDPTEQTSSTDTEAEESTTTEVETTTSETTTTDTEPTTAPEDTETTTPPDDTTQPDPEVPSNPDGNIPGTGSGGTAPREGAR